MSTQRLDGTYLYIYFIVVLTTQRESITCYAIVILTTKQQEAQFWEEEERGDIQEREERQ